MYLTKYTQGHTSSSRQPSSYLMCGGNPQGHSAGHKNIMTKKLHPAFWIKRSRRSVLIQVCSLLTNKIEGASATPAQPQEYRYLALLASCSATPVIPERKYQ
mmetsp:Transcript_12526/g.21003  ORF Transcript_12526/g.21003 Transcript_12526/m.21003 type:complete len:102 (+) Transcript_12526:75-380(+)